MPPIRVSSDLHRQRSLQPAALARYNEGMNEQVKIGRATLVHADCFEWLAGLPANTLHAVVTDPPYGVKEYDADQLEKRANGNGGIWRIPPSFDGHVRAPLPRFTALNGKERDRLRDCFVEWGRLTCQALRPGGHVFIATNAFICQLLYDALVDGGLEFRGEIIRLVRTLRGGDRPKNAEEEFPGVSSMPRGCYEPWGLFRKPLGDLKVSDCLRQYQTGGLRRYPAARSRMSFAASGPRSANAISRTTPASSRSRSFAGWFMPPCRWARALSPIPSWARDRPWRHVKPWAFRVLALNGTASTSIWRRKRSPG